MAYRETERTREARAAMHAKILRAAYRLLNTTGTADVREVAEQAGVATGTIYVHFPDMRELVAAAIARRLKADCDCMARAAYAADKPTTSLAAAIAVYVARGRWWRGLATVTADPTYRTGMLRELESYITQARLPDPEIAAIALYGLLNAVLVGRGRTATDAKNEPTLILMALRAVGLTGRELAAGLAIAETV